MALNNTGNLLADPDLPQVIRSLLCMEDCMTPAPANIMEHRPFVDQPGRNKGIPLSVFTCNIPHCPAMQDHFFATPCITQQIFRVSIRLMRHDPVTF
jgi:hypothetical protein